jgi:nucleoside-diphosphate-sugar epimerase
MEKGDINEVRVGQSPDLVLVTGASGYVASWLCKYLLEQGYKVRGTVREPREQDRDKILQELLPNIELVYADLQSADGWDKAVEGVKYIFHIASPQAVKYEKNRTKIALQGIDNLLNAVWKEPTVKKIVYTSSEAAVGYGNTPHDRIWTEKNWSDPKVIEDYMKSKTLTEQRAFELISNPELNKNGVVLSSINPGFIIGPTLVPWWRFSMIRLKAIIDGKFPAFKMNTGFVDVRDVAKMEIAIMQNDKTNGNRHLCENMFMDWEEFAKMLAPMVAPFGKKPKTKALSNGLINTLAFFVKSLRPIADKLKPFTEKTLYPNVYKYEHTYLKAVTQETIDRMAELGWL